MFAGMVPDAWVYHRAGRLIAEHGDDALPLTDQLIVRAVKNRQEERALLMLRIRLAVQTLQAPQTGQLH